MNEYIIEGGKTLNGAIDVCGAKNCVLVMLSACVLAKGSTTIRNCPDITDVRVMTEILRRMGCEVSWQGNDITVCADGLDSYNIPLDLSSALRGSVFLFGALCGRMGRATMGHSGGCSIGARPIDIHLDGLRRLGAQITENNGITDVFAQDGMLHGADITLRFPSVGATENLIMASVTAKGKTVLRNCAVEPEVEALQRMLCMMGADIKGIGRSTVTIHGVSTLHGVDIDVIPDRIVAATYISAVCACGGNVTVNKCNPMHLAALIKVLKRGGAQFVVGNNSVCVTADGLKAMGHIVTAPYPKFATDMQSLVMSCASTAKGVTVIEERMFENRLQHNVEQLRKMGANIELSGNRAHINGGKLYGCDSLIAADLRGGAGLVIAAMCAQGTSRIRGVEYIDRGYCQLENSLTQLGAQCVRNVVQ